MIKRTEKKEKTVKTENSQSLPDLSKILEGLKNHSKIICDVLKSRICQEPWEFWKSSVKLEDDQVDLVFRTKNEKKPTYALIDISIPHLNYGQKYTLPAKAKLFQKQENVPVNRIKKAIALIRKGTETISAQSSRIRCPIIEIQLERILPRETKAAAEMPTEKSDRAQEIKAVPAPAAPKAVAGVSPELLYALKEAIVHECLSTMHKRRNKYIRKGLWRWIEREIMDPNVHFYLIILSSIYQGKAGEVLSRRFKSADSFSNQIEEVIAAIFSKETNLADEIKKQSERHKKALGKFLACFSQTPPFEYLRSLFLKEFRSSQDGLKARLSVFTTLNQLLERCGFEGEKETQYPLEILDELGIFQGIMTGNYAKLRIDNASKKLKHLVPQADWSEEEVYLLRNQLAKALNLPPQEFNLNAFLPQAFVQDAKVLAETRKEAFRAVPKMERDSVAPANEVGAPATAKQHGRRNDERKPQQQEKLLNRRVQEPLPTLPTQEDVIETAVEEAAFSDSTVVNDANSVIPNSVDASYDAQKARRRISECDEATHRHFEFFGGQLDEDIDSVRLALAMCRHELEKQEIRIPEPEKVMSESEEDALHRPPLKKSTEKGFPVNHVPPRKKPAQTQQPGSSTGGINRNNNRRRKSNKPGQNKRRRPHNGDHGGINR